MLTDFVQCSRKLTIVLNLEINMLYRVVVVLYPDRDNSVAGYGVNYSQEYIVESRPYL